MCSVLYLKYLSMSGPSPSTFLTEAQAAWASNLIFHQINLEATVEKLHHDGHVLYDHIIYGQL